MLKVALHLGSDLWNAAFDSLLRLGIPEAPCLGGYLDNVAVLTVYISTDVLLNRCTVDLHIGATGKCIN